MKEKLEARMKELDSEFQTLDRRVKAHQARMLELAGAFKECQRLIDELNAQDSAPPESRENAPEAA